jgi:hypothetical protein
MDKLRQEVEKAARARVRGKQCSEQIVEFTKQVNEHFTKPL